MLSTRWSVLLSVVLVMLLLFVFRAQLSQLGAPADRQQPVTPVAVPGNDESDEWVFDANNFEPAEEPRAIFGQTNDELGGPLAGLKALSPGRDARGLRPGQTAGGDAAGVEIAVPGGVVAGCTTPHYLLSTDRDGNLVDNRFEWWNKRTSVPSTGPIPSVFECTFLPGLASVIGVEQIGRENSDQTPGGRGFDFLAWDSGSGTSPHSTAGIRFSVRTARPRSIPVLRQFDGDAMLLNEFGGQSLNDLGVEELRPSLWIDFDVPQRAVGLEYGFEDRPTRQGANINASGAKLIAYDRQGREITGSDGKGRRVRADATIVDTGALVQGDIGTRTLRIGSFDNKIGVRDQQGRISTVELRFDYDQFDRQFSLDGDRGQKIVQPQVVSRIWHEPLPPAAVLQDVVALERVSPVAVTRVIPDFGTSYAGHSLGGVLVPLPYRFDRAAAFLRGMRIETANRIPTDISGLSVGIAQDYFAFNREEIDTGNGIQLAAENVFLAATGSFITGDYPQREVRITAYYSLVGWDSEQVSLGVRAGPADPQQPWVYEGGCTVYNQDIKENNRRCGFLFGGLTRLEFGQSESQEVESFYVYTGAQRMFGGIDDTNGTLSRFPANGLWFSVGSEFRGSASDQYAAAFRGVIMDGRSLLLGPDENLAGVRNTEVAAAFSNDRVVLATRTQGSRSSPNDFFWNANDIGPGDDIDHSFQMWWPVAAHVAFLGVNVLHFSPEGPIAEIDLEFKGESYDGKVIAWKMGGGMFSGPTIFGCGVTCPDLTRNVFGLPVFGAIRDHASFAQGQLRTQQMILRDAVSGCTNRYHDQRGGVENTGSKALLIETIDDGATDNVYFEYRFYWRGSNLNIENMRARLPLNLWPGEKLEVSAEYSPPAVTTRINPFGDTHHGRLVFTTNSDITPQAVLTINGHTQSGVPSAEWRPDELDFGAVRPGRRVTLIASLVSIGNMPLCINDVRIKDNIGISYELTRRMVSDFTAFRVICDNGGTPAGPTTNLCLGETQMIAETNAGKIVLPIRANVLSPGGPPPVPPDCDTVDDMFGGCRDDN